MGALCFVLRRSLCGTETRSVNEVYARVDDGVLTVAADPLGILLGELSADFYRHTDNMN